MQPYESGEVLVITSQASLWSVFALLRSRSPQAEQVKLVVIARDQRADVADWIWSGYLSGLDRANNPLTIMGATDPWMPWINGNFSRITERGLKGITFQNMDVRHWELTDCDVDFIDCQGQK